MDAREKATRHLIELLSRGWDGVLTDADNAELNRLIREHGVEGGEMLLSASAIHFETEKRVASTRAYERAMAQVRADVKKVQDVGHGKKIYATRPSLLKSRVLQMWTVGALAASLLLAVVLQFRAQPAVGPNVATAPRTTRLLRPSMPLGSLVAVNQAVWAHDEVLKVGQNIDERAQLELRSGTAQVSLACGADLMLQGPCSITLVSENTARLDSGKVTAQVANWAKGFRIVAKELEVTDLGTRFAVSADGSGIVEAHVLEGSVFVEPLKERLPRQASMLLRSGQAVRVDSVRSKVDLIDARSSEFINGLASFRPLRPIEIWNTGAGGALGSEDPYWTITTGSEQFGPYPRHAIICDGASSYEDNRPDVSQWLSVAPQVYPGVAPESVHTFETTFDLSGYDVDTVYVVGYFLVDDAINELRINGHPVQFDRWVTTWDTFDFTSFHPIEITDHFVPGENVISIDVYNSPSNPNTPEDPNPTALRVEWQAFGCAAD